MAKRQVEQSSYRTVGAFATILENPRAILNYTPDRTNNRIRSPRLAASGQLEEGR